MPSILDQLADAATTLVANELGSALGSGIDTLIDSQLAPPTLDLMERNMAAMQGGVATEVPGLLERAMLEEVDPVIRPVLAASTKGIVGAFSNDLTRLLPPLLSPIPNALTAATMSIVKRLTKSLVGTGFSQGISAALSAAGSLLTHPYAVLVPQILAAVRQKVVESLAALAQPILALIPTTFDAAARPILSALGSSGNALIATASLLLGGLAYEKIRDAVMTVVQPKAVQAVAGVIQTTEREIMEEFEGQIVKVLGKPPANPNAGITPNAATAKSAQGAGVDGENGQLSSQNGQPMGHDGSAQGYEQQQQQQQQQ